MADDKPVPAVRPAPIPKTVNASDVPSAGATVTMEFRRPVMLTLTADKRIFFAPGIYEVPVSLADHWYLKANGVTKYEPKKSDTSVAVNTASDKNPAPDTKSDAATDVEKKEDAGNSASKKAAAAKS